MIEHALSYAARGWPVFPVNPTTNAPLLGAAHDGGDAKRGRCRGECGRSGHGFHDATTDPSRIDEWWGRNPRASIGVATGVAFDVLDIDCVDFDEGVADLPACETVGPTARSGGGGWHLYFRTTGLGRSIRFAQFCDWLGSDGYVIVPPSRHPSGGQYQWLCAPDDVPLHEPPGVLIDVVKRARAVSLLAASRPPQMLERSGGDGRAWSASGLIETMRSAQPGERNVVLHWCAARISTNKLDGECSLRDAHAALDVLHDTAVQSGLSAREVDRTIRSAWRGGRRG